MLIVDIGVNHDSAALIHVDDQNFVNQNDCKVFDRLTYFKDINVDYYAVQFSGATWHPLCYELERNEKESISAKKTASKLIAVRNAIKLINPKYYLPSAGPAIFPFLDDALSLGSGNIFIHQPELHQKLKSLNTKVVYLKPGEQFETSKSTRPIEPPSTSELEEIKGELFCIFEKIKDDEFIPEKLLKEVNSRLSEIKDVKLGSCPKILFDWGDEYLEIDLIQSRAMIIDASAYTLPDSYLRVSASKAYFSLMSNPEYNWQDIALSLRVSIERKPDILNTFANIFLFSSTTNIRSGFTTTLDIKEERIAIINPLDGKNYEIDRYCPHNGADLKDARIDTQGNLICPRHSWLFDLENKGNCRTAAASLNAKEVIETISLCDSISARLLKLNE
ncbi:Rieske (2Fe-2S) protein [Candidatus Pelagibacter sp.]|nr:Rieske (2Fe-2S) protein [Candidatus Pelagibacter sp.]